MAPAATAALFAHLSRPAAILLLTCIGGFIDAAGYMALFGLFTSSITGNLVVAAVAAPRKINVTPQITVLLVFFGAATTGAAIATVLRQNHGATNRTVARALFLLEFLCLVIFWALGATLTQDGGPGLSSIYSAEVFGLSSLSALAMGFQNRCGASSIYGGR